jgi:hypothetical protein
LRKQSIHVVLHVAQHFAGGVAFDDFFDPPAAFVVLADVNVVSVAE